MQDRSAGETAMMFAATENYVREVIHAFDAQGSRRWTQNGAAADQLDSVRPPFTAWSLTKLIAYLREHHRLMVSTETARRVLHQAGITWQRTKTWKTSRDPDFAAKMARILDLYDHPPADGRVLCVDEFGPLNLQPSWSWLVSSWTSRPAAGHLQPRCRYPADVRRAGSHLRPDVLPAPRPQTLAAVPRLLQTAPPPLPDRQVVFDLRQLQTPRQGRGHRLVRRARDELVYTPSNASRLNWVECEFTALRYFALDGSDYPSHEAQEAAIAGYLRWRNRHCHPKRHFAVDSKIRRPDYLPNVA